MGFLEWCRKGDEMHNKKYIKSQQNLQKLDPISNKIYLYLAIIYTFILLLIWSIQGFDAYFLGYISPYMFLIWLVYLYFEFVHPRIFSCVV